MVQSTQLLHCPNQPTRTTPSRHANRRGLSQLDGFVNVETGDVIVADVRAFPKLTDGNPLLQQVGGRGAAAGCGWLLRPVLCLRSLDRCFPRSLTAVFFIALSLSLSLSSYLKTSNPNSHPHQNDKASSNPHPTTSPQPPNPQPIINQNAHNPTQALLESPPLLPHQLFRHQLALAISAAEYDRAEAANNRLAAATSWLPPVSGVVGEEGAVGGEEYELDLEEGVGVGDEEGLDVDLKGDMSATWTP